uniref:Uncharacterized protein n=1 Tax=Anguilla anguilla TaxID=7936 RepID=A0A0E9RLL9_ANGAN
MSKLISPECHIVQLRFFRAHSSLFIGFITVFLL